MTIVQLSLDAALAERDLGLEYLEDRYPIFLDRARAVAIAIAKRKGWVTADDVRAVLAIPVGISPNVMGAVFKDGRFEFVCWEKSAQPQRHANRIGRWRLKAGQPFPA